MEKRGTDKIDDLGVAETPEDVAVLYSWANLHGAKYRDFSASRREYRAQLRHRAAEQVRQQALIAQAEAEAAAEAAEDEARKAAEAARQRHTGAHLSVRENLRQAEEAARLAAAERVEAARRAEAAATAEAAARREEREIAEAQASAERQAARYVENDRRRTIPEMYAGESSTSVPGEITDPYTPNNTPAQPPVRSVAPSPVRSSPPAPSVPPQPPAPRVEPVIQRLAPAPQEAVPQSPHPSYLPEPQPVRQDLFSSGRRPVGYHPDEASGVRQIYRGPEYLQSDLQDPSVIESGRFAAPYRAEGQPPRDRRTNPENSSVGQSSNASSASGSSSSGNRRPYESSARSQQPVAAPPAASSQPAAAPVPPQQKTEQRQAPVAPPAYSREASPIAPFWENTRPGGETRNMPYGSGYAPLPEPTPGSAVSSHAPQPSPAVSLFSQPAGEAARGRRVQDDPRFTSGRGTAPSGSQYAAAQEAMLNRQPQPPSPGVLDSGSNASFHSNPTGPAWLYAPTAVRDQRPLAPPPPQASVAETLQHSRERVASRWYALKGVFEQPGQEQAESVPVRQKEIRTPVLVVFSLAGGVGKTSLVATTGRALSSLGEKVLLTDTTSHGLLPFYFGASELRQGTVRTFSPPSGSTDAPIYLVSYDVGAEKDSAEREKLVEEIVGNSRGTHRLLLDLSPNSAWTIRALARQSPTILVPLAPDMNSVISLQAIEKFFQGMVDADGRPLLPYYLINQFDTSLPLHLDVREVLRRQLGDRLLPFVVHRATEVSEALAEGMTVIDYTPESPVSSDYLNIATWLRTVAAPATAGFRNVRWSER